jgi:hypothetical protein
MYRREMGERNPLRIFERSIHGGLGPGNIGVVLSRPGDGKTGFLVAVATDDCIRNRKVLHVNLKDNASEVREFYKEVFHDLAETSRMEDRARVLHTVEMNRRIHSFLGGSFQFDKLETALEYMTTHADFAPRVVILDGFPYWTTAVDGDLEAIRRLAQRHECEVWLSGDLHREGQTLDPRRVPSEIARFDRHLDVIVRLDPEADHVRLRLVKDHDNPVVADLHLELDPATFLIRWH